MTAQEQSSQTDPTVAVIVSQDDAHAFLLECLVVEGVDVVHHLQTPRDAIDLAMAGSCPDLVLVDVALYDLAGDAAATVAALRVVAKDAVVLEVGERLEHSGELLAICYRGNSLEAREWASLRG